MSADGQERRRYRRKALDLPAVIKVGLIHEGRGQALDISHNGLRVVNRIILARIRSHRIPELLNTRIRISFPKPTLWVLGKIVRVDAKTGDIAVQVYQTSDKQAWEALCEAGFPPKGDD